MSFISKIGLLLRTVRYLKPVQILYRLKYKFCPVVVPEGRSKASVLVSNLNFLPSIPSYGSYRHRHFTFLNQEKHFPDKIYWEYPDYGRLWTYNLNYFEFLNQEGMDKAEGCRLIEKFLADLPRNKTAWEPYPLSLRIIHWIRFFLHHQVRQPKFDTSLFSQLTALSKRPEYHLLGNHLLENGFALLFGAYYFNNRDFYRQASKILIPQLEEQILKDGSHFERSPMYHSIMLYRVLDCYNLCVHNELFGKEMSLFLKEKAEIMLGWLSLMVYTDGSIPLVNDAAFGIAPVYSHLKNYAEKLGLSLTNKVSLGDSGYRKMEAGPFEILADFGAIGPDYQPGHAHADTFNFELYVHGRPVIVDTGTSTYEINATRFYERSTAAHNTVVVNDRNSSEVWGGHRVARRAKVKITEDLPGRLEARHNGYHPCHIRKIKKTTDGIHIEDQIKGKGEAYFHFHPDEVPTVEQHTLTGTDYQIIFSGAITIETVKSWYAPEFNKRIPNPCFRITFENRLSATIKPLPSV